MSRHAEYFERALQAALTAPESTLSEDTARTPGTVEHRLLHTMASMAAEVYGERQVLDVESFMDSAAAVGSRDAVARLGWDRYRLPIRGASAARGDFAFSRTSDTPAVTLPAGLAITVGGVPCRLDAPVVFPAGELGPVVGSLTSNAAGPLQNVSDDEALVVITGPLPQPGITAPPSGAGAPLAGGNNEEPLADYVDRCRRWWANVQRGTPGAIVNAALSVEGVREAALFVHLDPIGRPVPAGTVVVSDADGNSNAALQAAVAAKVVEYAAAGFYAKVLGATVVYRDIQWTGTWRTGMANAQNAALVSAAIVAAVNRLGPNPTSSSGTAPPESILTPALVTSAMAATRMFVEGSEKCLSPVGPEAPGPSTIIRTELARVTQAGV